MHGVAELRPGAALHGPLTKSSVGEFPSPGRGCDLDLIAVLIELILYHLLDPVLVGPNHLLRRQEEVQILAVVLFELSPSKLRRRG